MNLAVSSIAWDTEENTIIAEKLQELNVKYVELAPTKLWDDPTKTSFDDARKVVEWWAEFGIEIVAFQSMLFARPDLKLFESASNRNECLAYLKDFIALAGAMGVKRMVFGSPKNRQRDDTSYESAFALAKDFFKEIAEAAKVNNVIFCIEPNAPQYACDFITTAKEGADLVRAVNHESFGLHLDTACMTLAGDDMSKSIKEYSNILNHFHVSSPMLEAVQSNTGVEHERAAQALNDIGYDQTISIEMRPGDSGANVKRVEAAVQFVQSTYLR